MDAFGLRSTIDAWLERIAAHGYVVLAPNLLYRSRRSPLLDDFSAMKDPEKRPLLFENLRPMMRALTPELAVQDAGAYIEFMCRQPQTLPGRIGVVGYCMGGAIAL